MHTNNTQWIQHNSPILKAFAYKHFQDNELVQDLVQDTLLAALKGRDKFRGEASEGTWLIAILKNKIRNKIRKLQKERSTYTDEMEANTVVCNEYTPEEEWQCQNLKKHTRLALQKIPYSYQRIFILKEVMGWSTTQIAKKLSLTENNVLVKLHRSRQKLQVAISL